MRLSSLSLTFLSTPGGLSRRPGSGRRWFVASSITAAAPGLLPRLLGPGEGGRRDGSQSTRGVSNWGTVRRNTTVSDHRRKDSTKGLRPPGSGPPAGPGWFGTASARLTARFCVLFILLIVLFSSIT